MPFDISNTFLSEIESGKTHPRMNFLDKLFAMYPLTPNYLFCGIGEMTREVQETVPKVIITKDFIEAGEIHTIPELLSLMELSSGFMYSVISLATRSMLDNKVLLLNALDQKEKKAQAETQAEKNQEDTPDQ